jgi:hypothetical protein
VGSLLAGLIVLLFSAPVAFAKGPPSRVMITGPGLAEPLVIDDPAVLDAFSLFQFEDVEHRIDAPADPGAGYTVTRYILQPGGVYQPWDVVIYYPDAQGGSGAAYLEGLIGGSSTQFDGYWYAVSRAGEQAMQSLIGGQPVRAGGGKPFRFGGSGRG